MSRTTGWRLSAGCSRWPAPSPLSAALAATLSPWFLLLTAFVGVNQWLYVIAGACPVSVLLTRVVGLRSIEEVVG